MVCVWETYLDIDNQASETLQYKEMCNDGLRHNNKKLLWLSLEGQKYPRYNPDQVLE